MGGLNRAFAVNPNAPQGGLLNQIAGGLAGGVGNQQAAQFFANRPQQARKQARQKQLDEQLRRVFAEQQQQRAVQAGSNAAAQVRQGAQAQPGGAVPPAVQPPASFAQQAAMSLLQYGSPEQQTQALQLLGGAEQQQTGVQSKLEAMQQDFIQRRQLAEEQAQARQSQIEATGQQRFDLEEFKTEQSAIREQQKQETELAFAADKAAAAADATFAKQRANNIAEARKNLPALETDVLALDKISNKIRSFSGRSRQTGAEANFPTFSTRGREFEDLLKEFNSTLTLSLIPKLAGTGPLSDSDVQLLKDSAGGLNPKIGDSAFLKKLDEVVGRVQTSLKNAKRYAGQDAGDPAAPQPETLGAPELLPQGQVPISPEVQARLKTYLQGT